MALYSAIGRVVVMWGQLEHHFGGAVELLYSAHGAANLKPTPPVSISNKLELWKLCFRKLPQLSAHQEDAARFAGDLKIASKNRNDLIHFSWGIAPAPHSNVVAGQSIRGVDFRELDLPLGALLDFAEHVEKLQLRLLGFTFLLAGAKVS
ncbi:MAG TPA: hypothetical protein VMT72_21680 [Pseudolabrys sp.]|nr:hypothetical protein [Pseudolabrys sp.]